jgi:tRNA nucleotidyltransferase (CCA-adding enzyme)
VLRHVSPAFAEDPLRVLRVARFAARFGFEVAPETQALMRTLSASGELAELAAERVWQELARGLMEPHPSRMIAVLRECGALRQVLPEVDALFGVPQPIAHHPEFDSGVHVCLALDYCARRSFALPVRYAVLAHDLGKATSAASEWPKHHAHEARGVRIAERLSERLRVPVDCRDVARLTARRHGVVHRALELRPATLLDLVIEADALRRPERLQALLEACEADACSRPGRDGYPAAGYVRRAFEVVKSVDAAAIARSTQARVRPDASLTPDAIPKAIRAARIRALAAWKRSGAGT